MRDSQLVYIIHLATETCDSAWEANKRSILRDLLGHIFKSETSNEVWISDTPPRWPRRLLIVVLDTARLLRYALAWDWPREDAVGVFGCIALCCVVLRVVWCAVLCCVVLCLHTWYCLFWHRAWNKTSTISAATKYNPQVMPLFDQSLWELAGIIRISVIALRSEITVSTNGLPITVFMSWRRWIRD